MNNFVKNLTEDQINSFLQECANRIATTGITCEFEKHLGDYHYNKFILKLKGEYFGCLFVYTWPEDNRLIPEIAFYTKIEMLTKSSFTKTAMRHNCTIKWNNYRTYKLCEEKDWNKCIDWIILLIKQYKTTLAKKKKFEMETDFE
jgi:hypothetical protein